MTNNEFHLFQETFSRPGGGGNDNITALQSQVHEVKGVMAQNIEKVIQRGERLDDLVDKTDELNAAVSTHRSSLTLKAPPTICSRRKFQILPLFQK